MKHLIRNGWTAVLRCVLAICLIIKGICYEPPSNCQNSLDQYYSILTLTCTNCPLLTEKASDMTSCSCNNQTYPNQKVIGFKYSNSCLSLGLGNVYDKKTQVLVLYNESGALVHKITNCSNSNAFPLQSQSRCVSCGYDQGMAYDSTLKVCKCGVGYAKVGEGCYPSPLQGWSRNPSSDTFSYLAEQYVKVGCELQNLTQPCNMLINMCVRRNYNVNDSFCSLLSNLSSQSKSSLPTYKFSSKLTDSIKIYASSKIGINTTDIKNQLNIFSVEYDVYGSIKEVATIDKDLFQCEVSDEDVAKFSSFGLNLYKRCSSKRTFGRQAYYDFFVETSEGQLAEIPVLIQGTYYKRISPAIQSGSHQFKLQFVSVPPLLVPILSLQTAENPTILTVSNSSSVNTSWTIAFIILNVCLFLIFVMIVYRFIQYNPSDDPNDQYFLCKGFINFVIKLFYTWSYGLWVWLFGFSLYLFSFYKFQQTIYLILPNLQTQWKSYYEPFLIIFYCMLAITTLSVWIVIYNLGEVDYFLIDWEKQKEIGKFDVNKQVKETSVWRRVLLVNELYDLAVSKNINIYFVSLFALLFLRGLQWMNLSYAISSTDNLNELAAMTSTSSNVILSYFIITFVFFMVAAGQLTVRHLVRIWYPLPAENFVDLCTMTNFSIMIFNQYLHGYYIHGVHPLGQSEGSLQYIETVFQKQAKAFGKGRGFKNEDLDACQTFEVIYPLHFRKNFLTAFKMPLMQKMVPKNYQAQSIFSNPLPQDWDESDYNQVQKISLAMVQNLKIYLQCVKASLRNVQDRSWWVKFISFPISQQMIGKTPVFLKDKWNEFTNAFLSGHEFLLLFNFINWINFWFIVTKNIYFANLLAIIVNELFVRFPSSLLMKRNISKNTLLDPADQTIQS